MRQQSPFIQLNQRSIEELQEPYIYVQLKIGAFTLQVRQVIKFHSSLSSEALMSLTAHFIDKTWERKLVVLWSNADKLEIDFQVLH